MLKPLEQTGYMQLNEKEIAFIISRPGVGTTTYLANQAKYASKEHKVLFIELESVRDKFIERFKHLDSDNINLISGIDILKLEDIEQYIIDNKPEYIYIDYFHILRTKTTQKDFWHYNNKIHKYILDKLNQYTEDYNVRIMTAGKYGPELKDENVYLTDTYEKANSVWMLKEDSMTRIK